jgi:hypothetical protein
MDGIVKDYLEQLERQSIYQLSQLTNENGENLDDDERQAVAAYGREAYFENKGNRNKQEAELAKSDTKRGLSRTGFARKELEAEARAEVFKTAGDDALKSIKGRIQEVDWDNAKAKLDAVRDNPDELARLRREDRNVDALYEEEQKSL